MTLTKNEFNEILDKLGYFKGKHPISITVRDYVYSFFRLREFDKDTVYAIISGARKKRIWEAGTNEFININLLDLINKMCTETDVKTYKKIHAVDQQFKKFYRENHIRTPKLDRLISKCLRVAKKINGSVNTEIVEIAEEDFLVMHNLASIYTSISEHTENKPIDRRDLDSENKEIVTFERIADYIVGQKIGRLDELSKLKDLDIGKQFDDFLKELTSDSVVEDERFTKQDISDLLEHTASIIKDGTAYKVETLRQLVAVYKEEISKIANTTEKDKKAIEEMSAKSLLKRAGTILQNNYMKDAFNFLMGKDIEACFEEVFDSAADKHKKSLKNNFPKLRLQGMTAKKHIHLLNTHASVLTYLTPKSINEAISGLTNGVYRALELGDGKTKKTVKTKANELKKYGFDVNTLITADNIWELFNTDVSKFFNEGKTENKGFKNIVDNIRTISRFVSIKDIHSIMQHNFPLFVKDNKDVENKLNTLLEKSNGDIQVFAESFTAYVNSKFKIKESNENTEGETQTTTQKKETIKVSKDKIVIDSFNFENFAQFAPSLMMKELKDIKDYYNATISEGKQSKSSIEKIYKQSKGIVNDITGVRLGKFVDRKEELRENPEKYGMNLSLLANKNNFVKKLNKFIKTAKELAKGENKAACENVQYALTETQVYVDALIASVKQELQDVTDLTDEFYKNDRQGKKQRNSGINFAEEMPKVQTLIEWIGNKNSIISRLISEDELIKEADSLLVAQAAGEKYAKQRDEMLNGWEEQRFNLNLELKYLLKLKATITACETELTPKQEIVQQVEEVIQDDAQTYEELVKRREILEGRIYNKEKEIRGKYRNVTSAIRSPHGKRLTDRLQALKDELEEIEQLINEHETGLIK